MSGDLEHDDRLVLSELLNHVLDKGVVITGDVTIAVGGIDLVRAGVSLYLSSVETLEQRPAVPGEGGDGGSEGDALSVLPGKRGA